MKSAINIFYFYAIPDNANGIQMRRFNDGLAGRVKVYTFFRVYDSSFKSRENEFGIKSPDLSFLDRVLYKLFPFLIEVFSFDKLIWSIYCVNRIKKEKLIFDYIHISSLPFILQWLGVYLKRKYKKKMVTQLLDPYYDNYLFLHSNNFISKKLRFLAEKEVFKISDCIVVNSNLLCDRIRARYLFCNDKVVSIPLCTDQAIVVDQYSKKTFHKVTLVYAGKLYLSRNLDEVVLMLDSLKKKVDDLENRFQILIVGNVPISEKENIRKNDCDKIIFFLDTMQKKNLFELLNQADGLLSIDSLLEDNIFFPSKLCEYFSLQKPIFAITPLISVTRSFLKDANHFSFSKNESILFSDVIVNLINDRCCYSEIINKKYYRRFLPKSVGNSFCDTVVQTCLKIDL